MRSEARRSSGGCGGIGRGVQLLPAGPQASLLLKLHNGTPRLAATSLPQSVSSRGFVSPNPLSPSPSGCDKETDRRVTGAILRPRSVVDKGKTNWKSLQSQVTKDKMRYEKDFYVIWS